MVGVSSCVLLFVVGLVAAVVVVLLLCAFECVDWWMSWSICVNDVVLSDMWCLIQCSPCLSQKSWLSSCAVSGLCAVVFGCVASRSVEGAALGLHTHSCVFGFVGGVSISCCGCELCPINTIFVVALRVGAIFLLNLVSPAQSTPSSLLCSSCLESCLVLMMASRQSSSSSSGVGQPLLCGVKSALCGRL